MICCLMTSILGDGSAIRHPKPDKAGSAGLVNVFSLSAKPTEAEPPGAPKVSKNPAADSGTEQPTDQRPAPVQQNVDAPQTAKNFKLQRRHKSVETA